MRVLLDEQLPRNLARELTGHEAYQVNVEPVPRPNWEPLPMDGCRDVEGRVFLQGDGLVVANLRFAPGGTIHEHAAPHEIDVICVAGSGFVSVDGERSSLREGERVRWPAGALHRAWTEDCAMETLMVEHVRDA